MLADKELELVGQKLNPERRVWPARNPLEAAGVRAMSGAAPAATTATMATMTGAEAEAAVTSGKIERDWESDFRRSGEAGLGMRL